MLFLLCPVGLSIAAGDQGGPVQVVLGWFCGWLIAGFGAAVLFAARSARRERRLHLRGISVVAELTEQEPPHHQRMRLAYEFTDLTGHGGRSRPDRARGGRSFAVLL
ncbi:hypothetical protein ACWC5I_46120 [Kitasatospora sp. NPDC001574]